MGKPCPSMIKRSSHPAALVQTSHTARCVWSRVNHPDSESTDSSHRRSALGRHRGTLGVGFRVSEFGIERCAYRSRCQREGQTSARVPRSRQPRSTIGATRSSSDEPERRLRFCSAASVLHAQGLPWATHSVVKGTFRSVERLRLVFDPDETAGLASKTQTGR